MVKKEILDTAPDNQLIRNTLQKADLLLDSYKNPVCSISGGSDSDVMLDLLERVRNGRKITYVFFDTGIEYQATKNHLNDLEAQYGIEIVRRRAKKTVPVGCKEYGVPFLSKMDAMYIGRLQKKNFDWQDDTFDGMAKKYSNCVSALKWWGNGYGEKGRFQISTHAGLKEFMLDTPPTFAISNKCCKGAKKDTAYDFLKEQNAMLNIVGERRAEGGMRATSHTSCFEPLHSSGIARYMPLYFWSDEDKQQYKEHYGIVYSDCYEVYGLKRTGCAGCPFSSKFEEELEIIQKYEPQLYKAVNNIFGKSYEYTRKYREFKANFKGTRKKNDTSEAETSGDKSEQTDF